MIYIYLYIYDIYISIYIHICIYIYIYILIPFSYKILLRVGIKRNFRAPQKRIRESKLSSRCWQSRHTYAYTFSFLHSV